MFVEAAIFAIIIGYLLRGKLNNIEIEKIKGITFVLCAFLIKLLLVICIQKGFLKFGIILYIFYVVQYMLILVFIFFNRRNRLLVIMGLGILLNALVIFANGGVMPVSMKAVQAYGIKINVSSKGMYSALDNSTRLAFLGDIFPAKLIIHFIFSIGDIVTAIGMMMYIIFGMRKKLIEE